jgi:hypothetical protein
MKKAPLIITIPFISIFIALTMLLIAIVFQRSFIYMTGNNPATIDDIKLKNIKELHYKTIDNIDLYGWYKKAKDNKKTILYFHGNRPHLGFFAPKFKEFIKTTNMGIFFAEYRGYGGNKGHPTEEGLITDARAAYNKLKALNVKEKDIIIYGENIGASLAVALGAENTPFAIALEKAFTSTSDIVKAYWPRLPIDLIIMDKFDSLTRIGSIKAPLLIMNKKSKKDMNQKMGQRLFDAAPTPKEIYYFETKDNKQDVFSSGGEQKFSQWLEKIKKQ